MIFHDVLILWGLSTIVLYTLYAIPDKSPKLLDQVRERIRTKHYSLRIEKTYLQWIRRYILFHNKRHPKEIAAPEVERFLTHLAVERNEEIAKTDRERQDRQRKAERYGALVKALDLVPAGDAEGFLAQRQDFAALAEAARDREALLQNWRTIGHWRKGAERGTWGRRPNGQSR